MFRGLQAWAAFNVTGAVGVGGAPADANADPALAWLAGDPSDDPRAVHPRRLPQHLPLAQRCSSGVVLIKKSLTSVALVDHWLATAAGPLVDVGAGGDVVGGGGGGASPSSEPHPTQCLSAARAPDVVFNALLRSPLAVGQGCCVVVPAPPGLFV